MCRVLKVSRRGYYSWLARPESSRSLSNKALLVDIRRVFKQYRCVYGAPRIYRVLRDEGIACGLNRVARLMQQSGLLPRTIRKFRKTTDSRKSYSPAPNILGREFVANAPNRKWVSDVTFIATREGWLYLAVVLDLYSRKVVGWSMGDRLTTELAQRAMRHAIESRQPKPGLLAHSDRGMEYYAKDYQCLLKQHGMICSMSGKGECHDNAVAESFFHTLKVEQVYHDDYHTRDEARSVLFDYIELFYNRQRKHSFIDYQTPMAYEECRVA